MKALLQKVSSATVSVDNSPIGTIRQGYVILLGVLAGDTEDNVSKLAEKIVQLRLFEGEDGKINDQSILDIEGDILVVSQFTLAGNLAKGNRPDFTEAAPPQDATPLYESFISALRSLGVEKVETGEFGAYMQVSLVNDGPVTLMSER